MSLLQSLSRNSGRLLMLTLILAAASLGGCTTANLSGGSSNSGKQMFDLSSVQTGSLVTNREKPRNVQLVVYEPTTVRTMEGERVVIRLANSQVNYLDGANWSDRLPVLVQNKLVESLNASRQFRAVSNGREKVDADVSLSTTIEAFEVALGPADQHTGHVNLLVKLVDERSGSVLDSRSIKASAPLKGKAPSDYVIAIKQAFATTTDELTAWIKQIKIKERSDKLPAAIARGSVIPSQQPDSSRLSQSQRAGSRL
jgi:cholesterol transport system auxiliary component